MNHKASTLTINDYSDSGDESEGGGTQTPEETREGCQREAIEKESALQSDSEASNDTIIKRLEQYMRKKENEGKNPNRFLKTSRDYNNPKIREKLIAYCGINEIGSNMEPHLYDPYSFEEMGVYKKVLGEKS